MSSPTPNQDPTDPSGGTPANPGADSQSGERPSYPNGPWSNQQFPPPARPDPDLIAFYDALAFTLHGGSPQLSGFPLFWDGTDDAGVTLRSIKGSLAKAIPPGPPATDQPPDSWTKKQGA